MLTGGGPEGAVGNAKGRIFVNLEDKNALDVIDTKTWKVIATWPIAPCDGPTGIAMDRAANRIFSGCGKTSVVTDASTGKVVAEISNGNGVDALGWDQSQKFMYIPAGRDGNVTVVHEDSPDKYTVTATVATQPGAKTISVDPTTHTAYLFQPEYGPPPAPPAGTTPDSNPRRRPRGPMIGTWFISITH
jgi:DNA-binding beta-propeller fold protein YncE